MTAVSGPASATPWGSFTASVTVCNQGTDYTDAYVALLLSDDAQITSGDVEIASQWVGGLGGGQCATRELQASASVPDGAYTLGAIVDPYDYVFEADETNNARAGGPMGVGYAPDLVVTAISGPPSALRGSQVALNVTVCNQGTSASYGTDIELRLSSDLSIGSEDPVVAGAPLGYLDAGQCQDVSVNGYIDCPDGVYYFGAVADPYDWVYELIESNNTKASTEVGLGNAPDLVIEEVSAPASATPGSPVTASVRVCNQGTQPSYGANVALVLSSDQTIDTSDYFAGNAQVGGLTPGGCETVSLQGYTSAPDGVYVWGALADPDNWTAELIESNNTKAGAQVGIGYAPDLVVAAVSGPASATPGGPITATVTVCNQGTQPSYGTNVELRLSGDTVIGSEDQGIGDAPVGYLEPGQCQGVAIQGYAYVPDGAYTLGAVVDPWEWVYELIETNNSKAGSQVGVGYKPDLVVQAVSGPPSVGPGATLSANITVCNQGTTPSYGTEVELRLSTDTTIDSGDWQLGGTWVGYLDVGQCQIVTVLGNPYVPDGAYYLGARVDPQGYTEELLESNNAKAGAQIGVGYGPDFVVTAVSGPPSVAPGNSFTAAVTVCNQGTQPGYGNNIELRLSSDPVIDAADIAIGSVPTNYLSPGQCQTVAVPGYANEPWGAYYLAAVVDPQNNTPELIETNNAKAGAQIGVGLWSDLVVQSVSGPASTTPGGNLAVSVTVCNQGQQSNQSTNVQVRLSSDATIGNEDTQVGAAPVDNLPPGQCQTIQVQAYAYVPDGAYYLGAVVDPMDWANELIETNNSKAGAQVGVGHKPDLVVQTISGPPSVLPPGPIAAAITVCNQGTQTSYGSNVELRLSTDTAIGSEDSLAGVAPLGYLAPGECQTLPVSGYASVPSEGAYYLGGRVDPQGDVDELIEDNNARAGAQIGVGYGPDFVVTSISGPGSVTPGGSFTVTATVCNQGTQPSYANDVELRLSTDATIDDGDEKVGSAPANQLAPGQCQTLSVYGYANVADGAYTLGVVVDPQNYTPELLENNNAKAGAQLGVGFGPDLYVKTVSGPPSATSGSNVNLSVTVCNQGTQPSYGSNVEVRLSSDPTIGTQDPTVGNAPLGTLNPGACQTLPISGWISAPEGVYFLGAVVDAYQSVTELIETNNTLGGAQIALGYNPDLIVERVSGPASATPGANIDVTVRVCNQGTLPSPSSYTEVRLSSDAVIGAEDPLLGVAPINNLAPGACQEVTVPGSVYGPQGTYYFGAMADANNNVYELIETNNTTTGARIGVGYDPDLVVTQVSAPASATPGTNVTASVTVCNQGTASSSGGEVELRQSSDQRFDDQDHWLGNVPLGPLNAGQCQAVQIAGNINGPQGLYFLAARVDPYDSVHELFEDNNDHVQAQLGVGFDPDLVVTAVSGPTSATSGSNVSLDITVCNQGTTPSYGFDIEVRLSLDALIDAQDLVVGSRYIGSLDVGECKTRPLSGYVSGPPGAYHLGAVADPYQSVIELIETNNSHSSSLITLY